MVTRKKDPTPEEVEHAHAAYAIGVAQRRIARLTYATIERGAFIRHDIPLDAVVRFYYDGPEMGDHIEVSAAALGAGMQGVKATDALNAIEVRLGCGSVVVRPVASNLVRIGRAPVGR